MRYEFEWDPQKANRNLRKHGLSFDRATTIFRDPNLLSIPDEEHSEDEERWITMGMDDAGALLVVVHKFRVVTPDVSRIRVISARKATRQESKYYEEGI